MEDIDDVDLDQLAAGAVASAGLVPRSEQALPSGGRAPLELGLEVRLDEQQLYLRAAKEDGGQNVGRRRRAAAFDTAAPSGVNRLRVEDFSQGLARQAPAPLPKEREVRAAAVRPVDDQKLRQKEAKEKRTERLEKWFGLKKQQLTPEMEKELMAIKLRGNIDPKRFYKGNDSKELPKYFTVATEVGGGMRPAGVKASPEPRPGRGRSFLDTVLQDQRAWEWTSKRHGEAVQRGNASKLGGHGKRGSKGTKRGGSWKKKKRS